MEWININTGLPDTGVKVMVKTRDGKVCICEMYIPKDCYGNILGEKEWKGSYSFKQSIIEWRMI